MRSRMMWPIALMAVFAMVAATAGSAGAKPPTKPPTTVADVEITNFEYGCKSEPFAISVTATAEAYDGTRLDHVGLGIREYRLVEAETGGYYPFDTTLDVADWYSHLDRWNGTLGNDETLKVVEMATSDGTNVISHHWNIVLNPTGEPDANSWFIVEAWAEGSVTQRGNNRGESRWDNDQKQVFLQCANPLVIFPETGSPNSPWADWNWNEP